MTTPSPSSPPLFVSYCRVSTRSQEASGLGLASQRDLVRQHIAKVGGVLVDEVIEIESGSRNRRPKLAHALALAREHGATLLVAKLDRLSRNVHFLSALMESGTPFVCCDMPSATPLTLHVLAAVAEQELAFVSERTKEGLRMARAKGRVLGNPRNLNAAARQRGADTVSQLARNRYRIVGPLVVEWRANGMTLDEIATRLNGLHVELARGKGRWYPATVKRVLDYQEKWSQEHSAA